MAESGSAFELVTLRNGHRTVREVHSGEVMHPSIGPWAEANRLYVEQSHLAERLAASSSPEPVRVYDVGLGAAANAAAAIHCALQIPGRARSLEIVSFELDLAPLKLALSDLEGFSYLGGLVEPVRSLLERGEAHLPGIDWRLLFGDFRTRLASAPKPVDLIFFDPFSPATNPKLWTVEVFESLKVAARGSGAELFTYSAATPTRAALFLAGFFVGRGVGVGTKAETTVASTEPSTLRDPLDVAWLLRWNRSSARRLHERQLSPDEERRLAAHPQLAAR